MSLKWREQLSVGNNVIDADHKHLIDIINRVEASLHANNRNELSAELAALEKYSREHFAREEKIASAAGYAYVPKLSESHAELLESINRIKCEISDEWTPVAIEHFSGLLRAWLIDHVIKEDLLMRPVLLKHSPSYDPR